MYRLRRAAALFIVLGLIAAAMVSGCEQGDAGTTGGGNAGQTPGQGSGQPPSGGAPPEYIIPSIPVSTAPGILVEENHKAVIDYSNFADGYIMAKFIEDADTEIRALITAPDETEYTYRLTPGGDYEVFPLSNGDGEYTIRVFEQVEGGKYALVVMKTIDAVLTDAFAPFLRPNQFVNFNKDSEVVRKAAELTAGADDLMDKIRAIYHFMISNIEYDFDLAETVQSGYLPVLDTVLERGMGICFDYSSVMTAMLRSQGIPTKLVFGFAEEAYHAWISVYSEETGWIDDLIFFDGFEWKLMDPTFNATGDAAEVAAYIGTGSHYRVKYLY